MALHRLDPALYARLDWLSGGCPRLLVGEGLQRWITVTPPLSDQVPAGFRWERWGARIASVVMPERAAVAIRAELTRMKEGPFR